MHAYVYMCIRVLYTYIQLITYTYTKNKHREGERERETEMKTEVYRSCFYSCIYGNIEHDEDHEPFFSRSLVEALQWLSKSEPVKALRQLVEWTTWQLILPACTTNSVSACEGKSEARLHVDPRWDSRSQAKL